MMRKRYWALLTMVFLFLAGMNVATNATSRDDNAAETKIKASGEANPNYGEVLQKAIFFYEAQRSGKLPAKMRLNWRGDSGLSDGADHNVDLTGGWYDAGDHVKFNLPLAYSVTMLNWSIYENRQTLVESGQLGFLLENIKWATDYLMKCHTAPNEFYYQVGEGGADHSWWGPCEVMPMARPSYKVTVKEPGSAVVGEAAAALAATAITFKDSQAEYAKKCLDHAQTLFEFADATKSDAGYTMADSFYKSWSGFYDELSWAATWLYLATGKVEYLQKAESYVVHWERDSDAKTIFYKWAHSWDDKHYGAALLLARITEKPVYRTVMEDNLDWWSVGCRGERISYNDGLAWLTQWGSLRYSTTTAFLAGIYANWQGCSREKAAVYRKFAKEQVDYALGVNSQNRSFVVGYGPNWPQHAHHRTAQGSWSNNLDVPAVNRHILYGALVGGPVNNGAYSDRINNYVANEVACDYNAGLIGAVTELYRLYGGQPLENFIANEAPAEDEFFVEAQIRATGANATTIAIIVNNQSGWPARIAERLAFRYYVDLSEVVKAGGNAALVRVSVKPDDAEVKVKASTLQRLQGMIYYTTVDFAGTQIFPGGAADYRKLVELRFSVPAKYKWNPQNDPSYVQLTRNVFCKTKDIPLYDHDQLIFGVTPGN